MRRCAVAGEPHPVGRPPRRGLRSSARNSCEQRAGRAGCLVLDVRLPGMSGLDLQQGLAEAGMQIPIIFITGHGDIPMTVRAMKAGAAESSPSPSATRTCSTRSQAVAERARGARRADLAALRAVPRADPREREVMKLVVAGLLNKQIAAELGMSETTVRSTAGRSCKRWGRDRLPSWCAWRTGSASSPKSRSRLSQSVIEARIERRAVSVNDNESVADFDRRRRRRRRHPLSVQACGAPFADPTNPCRQRLQVRERFGRVGGSHLKAGVGQHLLKVSCVPRLRVMHIRLGSARSERERPLAPSRPLPSLVLLRGALQMRMQQTWECSQRQAALSYWAGSRSTLACACCTSR